MTTLQLLLMLLFFFFYQKIWLLKYQKTDAEEAQQYYEKHLMTVEM